MNKLFIACLIVALTGCEAGTPNPNPRPDPNSRFVRITQIDGCNVYQEFGGNKYITTCPCRAVEPRAIIKNEIPDWDLSKVK